MKRITADQLVYARVESVASPKRVNGFQVIYSSPGLDGVADEIEGYIQNFYYKGHPTTEKNRNLERQQFFVLHDNRVVLAKSVPAAHARYIDKGNRGGAFITHCLILTPEDFKAVSNDPFVILNQFDYLHDPEELYEKFVVNAAHLPPTVSIEPYDGASRGGRKQAAEDAKSNGWAADEVRKLLKLAIGAAELKKRGECVVFYGQSDAVIDTLDLVFGLIGPEMRLDCTFCTEAIRYFPPPGMIWAVGVETLDIQENSSVDVDNQRVKTDPDSHSPVTLYLGWINDALQRCPLSAVLAFAPTVRLVCKAIEHAESPPTLELNRDACADFFRYAKDVVGDCLVTHLENRFSSSFSNSFTEFLFAHIEPADLTLYAAADRLEADLSTLAFGFVFVSFRDRSSIDTVPQITKADWQELRNLARSSGDWPLLHWASVLDRSFWKSAARKASRVLALSRMSASEFDKATRLMPTPIEPEHFVCEAHWRELLTIQEKHPVDARLSFRLLCELFMGNYPVEQSASMQACIEAVSQRQAKSLWKLVRRRDNVTDEVKKQLQIQAGRDGKATNAGWMARLTSRIRRNTAL